MWRKFKAAVFTGGLWASTWAAWGTAVIVVVRLFSGPMVPGTWEVAGRLALSAGMMGFVGGVAFSGILSLIRGRRTIEQLSPWRLGVAGLGAGLLLPVASMGMALSGMGMPVTARLLFQTLLIFGVPAGLSAYGMIKVAKLAPVLPSAGDESGLLSAPADA